MEYPEGLRYSKEHEWVRVEGNRAIVGITDYAQDALGDVVYVQLPDAGLEVIANASIAEIESTKSVSEVYAPVTGTVVEVNGTLEDAPEQLNTDPYGAGWIFVVELVGAGRGRRAHGRGGVPRVPGGVEPSSAGGWSTISPRRRDAAAQMEADLACLDEVAAGGPPVLRLYTWVGRRCRSDASNRRPTSTSTRAGPAASRSCGARRVAARSCTARISPTRSRCPRPAGAAGHVDALYRTLAGALIAGLATLGVTAAIGSDRGSAGSVCFAAAQGADLRVGDRKICGSAQVQRGSTVLQHGSVLLDRLPFDELDLLLDPAPTQTRFGSPSPGRRTRTPKRGEGRPCGAQRDPARTRRGPHSSGRFRRNRGRFRRHARPRLRIEGRGRRLRGSVSTCASGCTLVP